MHFILSLLLSTLSLLLTAYLIPGFVITNIFSAIIAALVIGFFNATLRPILLLITLPINFLTLGLFSIIINAFTLWIASLFVPGFHIESMMAALIAVIVLSLISLGIHLFQLMLTRAN